MPERSEPSGEYQVRFRYELWSPASDDLPARPSGEAKDLTQRNPEPESVSNSASVTDARNLSAFRRVGR